jgi:hypothetical protein
MAALDGIVVLKDDPLCGPASRASRQAQRRVQVVTPPVGAPVGDAFGEC